MKKLILSILLLLTAFSLKANEGDTITFRSKNRLEWSDFKKYPDLNDSLKIYIDLTIVTFTKKINVWWGTITVESYAGIRRDLSWAKPQYKSQQMLEYVQLKYEIANYFAKKSEKEINDNKINASNTRRIKNIIETHISAMNKAMNEYDIESNFGSHAETIDIWRHKLNNDEI